jgi:ketosteroid isomerase-like protein
MDVNQLVADHVARFNRGVAAGDFAPLVESFADDATMSFAGVPVGPFTGKAAIAEAYRANPPDDAIEVIAVYESGPDHAYVGYVWRADPAGATGEMRLRWRPEGLLQSLDVRLPAPAGTGGG